jgi:RNA polymerase sigma factor (sigma-70 family)
VEAFRGVDPSVQVQRLKALPGSEAIPALDDFDPGNDLHIDAAAGFLIDRFYKENDVEALALLFEVAYVRMREIAHRVTRQLAVAIDPDDLVAGFMTRIFVDVRRPRPRVRRFLGLAHTAMRNDARNQLRQHARAWRRMLTWHSQLTPPADPGVVADEREQTARYARLGLTLLAVAGRCYHSLRDRDRRVLLLREVDGYSYERLAEALRVPSNQVGTILKRARARWASRIAQVLAAWGDDGSEDA